MPNFFISFSLSKQFLYSPVQQQYSIMIAKMSPLRTEGSMPGWVREGYLTKQLLTAIDHLAGVGLCQIYQVDELLDEIPLGGRFSSRFSFSFEEDLLMYLIDSFRAAMALSQSRYSSISTLEQASKKTDKLSKSLAFWQKMMMLFMISGFWCQSAVCRKLAASTQAYEFLAVLANAITFSVSPNIKHLRDVRFQPSFRYKLEAISQLPCFLHFSAILFIKSFLRPFYIADPGSSSGKIFLIRSSWMGTFC